MPQNWSISLHNLLHNVTNSSYRADTVEQNGLKQFPSAGPKHHKLPDILQQYHAAAILLPVYGSQLHL